jgi:hypothetical protein
VFKLKNNILFDNHFLKSSFYLGFKISYWKKLWQIGSFQLTLMTWIKENEISDYFGVISRSITHPFIPEAFTVHPLAGTTEKNETKNLPHNNALFARRRQLENKERSMSTVSEKSASQKSMACSGELECLSER